MQPLQVAISLAFIVIIIVGAYYVTYYIGAKSSGQGKGRVRNRSITLIDRFAISKDKSFCLVEIAGKIYVVGVANQSMTLIDTLDAAEYKEAVAEHADAPAWQTAPGMMPGGRLANRLFNFLSAKTAKPPEKGGGAGGSTVTFSDSMRSAREKDDE